MASSPRPWLTVLLTVFVVCLPNLASATVPPPGLRLALVVGNADYRSGRLPTAADDAGLVAEALAQDGFAVTALADADAATLRKAVDAFAEEIRKAGDHAVVFVYMSGTGVQYGGRNYMVPARASIERQIDIPDRAVSFAEMLRVVEPVPAHARFFVFDLAYPTPLATAAAIPLAPGLRHMQPSPGSLYAFNTAPGTVAPEGVPPFGLYARAWAEALREPGLGIHTLFSRVRLRVAEITSGAVVPWDNGEVDPDISFVPAASTRRTNPLADRPLAGLPSATVFWAALAEDTLAGYQAFLTAFPNDPLAAKIRAMKAVRLEAANWAEACRADTPAAYWTFMRRYPRGPHYVDVRRRLEAIHAALEAPMRFDPTDLGGLPSPTESELRAVDHSGSDAVPVVGTAIPPPPPELLPPMPSEVGVELAPPPLVPDGALPVSFPIAPAPGAGEPGIVTQPFVPELGPLTMTTASLAEGGTSVTLTSEAGPITRTTADFEGHSRSLEQSDAAGEVVSRTVARRAGDTLTLVQTGPDGRLLIKLTTRFSLNGDRDTIVSNGAGQLVAEVAADKRDVLKSIKRGTAAIGDVGIMMTPVGEPIPPPNAPQDDEHGAGSPNGSRPSATKPSAAEPSAATPSKAEPDQPAPLPPKSALRIRPAEPDPNVSGPPVSGPRQAPEARLPGPTPGPSVPDARRP